MKITLNEDYTVTIENSKNLLGYVGETNCRTVYFLGMQVDGADSYRLRMKFADNLIYDADITDSTFTPSASIMRMQGNVQCQIIACKQNDTDYDIVKKSNIFILKIGATLDNTVAPVPQIGYAVASTLVLTQEQYDALTVHSIDTVYYVVSDDKVTQYLGDIKMLSGTDTQGIIAGLLSGTNATISGNITTISQMNDTEE